MKRLTVPTCISGLAFVAVLAQCAPSSPANSRRAIEFRDQPELRASLGILPVSGDFDGDLQLDQAELHVAGSHRCIRVRFGNSRESHLDFRDSPRVRGTLLTRDINHDNNPDLIWISHLQSQRPVVWLGDGFGHFLGAACGSADGELQTLLFGDSNPGLAGVVKDEQVFLTPDPISSELARAANTTPESGNAVLIAGGNNRRDLGLYLSCLRERGPPLHTSFA